MKKIIVFILISILFIGNVYADDIASFSCEYKVKNNNANFKLIMNVDNYNKSDSSGNTTLKYEDSNGNMITLSEFGSTSNVKGSTNKDEVYRFFALDKKFYKYVENFDGECKPLYLVNYNTSKNTYDIENNDIDPSLGKSILINVDSSTLNGATKESNNNTSTTTNNDNNTKKEDTTKKEETKNNNEVVELRIDDSDMECAEILGPIMLKVVKNGITIVQVVCALIAIVNGMILLIPAVVSKDADELKKVSKKLVILAVILALVIIFKPIIRILGTLLEYDTSCIL